jgi:hypothetical protein
MDKPQFPADTIGNQKDITGQGVISNTKPLTQLEVQQIAEETEASYLEASKTFIDETDVVV